MKDPNVHIYITNGKVRVEDSSLIELIPLVSKYMETIHRTQLNGIREEFFDRPSWDRSNPGLSKTKFLIMHAIFQRYKDSIVGKMESDDYSSAEEKRKRIDSFLEAIQESEAYVKRIDSLSASNQSAFKSNHEVRKRPTATQ